MSDIAIAWRDEQIGMLKAEIHHLNDELIRLEGLLVLSEEANGRLFERVRNLEEEIADAARA